jgi:hypothetical protein
MSIAVSATILPSRILTSMLAFMYVFANASIGYVGLSVEVGNMATLIIVLISSMLSLTMLLRYFRGQLLVRLDISDSGEMIFRILRRNPSSSESLHVKLLERSTLWPHLILLSLCSDDGKVFVVPILRDSVDGASFRKLSVALNWITTHSLGGVILNPDISSGNF